MLYLGENTSVDSAQRDAFAALTDSKWWIKAGHEIK